MEQLKKESSQCAVVVLSK